jgi:hypothetical protein
MNGTLNAVMHLAAFAGIALLAVGTFCALIGPPEPATALLAIGAIVFIPPFFWLLGRELDERKVTNV